MVYVLDIYGNPLMPTKKHGKVRHLLNDGKAKVVQRCPFVIQLQYETTNYKQDITLGVDAGSKHIGLSATTKSEELYASDVELRDDIVRKLSNRKANRKNRRYRKIRYRKARFQNRRRPNNWLAPSIRQKIQCHFTAVENVHKILPITKIIVEVASFDIQKIKNPEISGIEYQHGEQMNFWNVREYVFWRDGHICQCCHGKSGDKILNVHHIESRQTGGNAPNNLVTLCATCHHKYHLGEIQLPETIKRGVSYKDKSFMGIMRWAFYNGLKTLYPNVSMTYGYITKGVRIENGLPKEHYIDARCITGNPSVKPLGYYYYQRKIRCHNRQLHKEKTLKGGKRKPNQAPYLVKGFRLFDRVLYNQKEYFIFARRQSGYFKICTLDGEKIDGVNCKKLKFVATSKYYLIERREEKLIAKE